MNYWLSNLLGEIHFSMQEQRRSRGRDFEYRTAMNRMSLKEKLKRYNYDHPTCCTKAEFLDWLDNVPGARMCNFCRDCTPEYRAEKELLGVCNCQYRKK